MKILFIGKRHPQQRDLIERPYGRFHHLPVALAALGHEVEVLLCSHRRLPSLHVCSDGVSWRSEDIRTRGSLQVLRTLAGHAGRFRPDWVIGVSDTHFGWLAQRLAGQTGALLAVDAYDNYEAYMPWNLPLHWLWRRAVRKADLVTAAGPQLAQLLQSYRRGRRAVELLPMAADPSFRPLDKQQCRAQLALPQGVPLIGYLGSWAHNRGTAKLLDAFRVAREARPDLVLVLSGRPPQAALREPGVVGCGYVADAQLPALVNALDVACVITANTGFGRFSYPAKLCEAMACAVPVLATDTAPVRWMLGDRRKHLAPVGDATAFARGLLGLLDRPRVEYGPRATWGQQAHQLDSLLRSAIRNANGAARLP